MALTQEAILNTLLEGRGKVRNSELLSKFKDRLNCSDPAEKKHNRDLFKTFVNNVGVVKELQETKYIVLKKVYHHLLEASNNENTQREDNDHEGEGEKEQNGEGEDEKEQNGEGKKKSSSKASDGTAELSPIEFALERSKNVDFKPKKSLNFIVPLKSDPDDKHGEAKTNKPFALPLRMPQTDVSQHHKKKLSTSDSKRTSIDGVTRARHFKTPKQAEEPKYNSHHCPLDPAEHEWMVKSAAGHWSQVYGLLLKDAELAEKKDFMSGFTALHWAVKCGNIDMVCRIIEVSRKSGHGVDVDAKSNGGYTPLHIAAIHNHDSLIELLVRKYCANGNLRDNCGKKPYHYLRKGVSGRLRELLGDPKAVQQEVQQVREEVDPHRYPKSRLFPTHPVGIKKKNKGRIQFMSLAEDVRAERDEAASHKQRLVSDVFP
ncbi:Ankyrin repeat domain-containing protein SOWAHA [Anabarilius grahami]|uniref:Ankyrin repeat domain-containing protein SOWAHA n=1 Tax=Anabarilius grahami TaxID=495550 RepID=A0A3N0XUH0_ANAGA|nr:Ankyrin repeat domain-containing protein SOWAHA [Anabarilius grahami]